MYFLYLIMQLDVFEEFKLKHKIFLSLEIPGKLLIPFTITGLCFCINSNYAKRKPKWTNKSLNKNEKSCIKDRISHFPILLEHRKEIYQG